VSRNSEPRVDAGGSEEEKEWIRRYIEARRVVNPAFIRYHMGLFADSMDDSLGR